MGSRRKNKIEKKELPESVKQQKSVIEYIVSHKEVIASVLALCAAVYPIINATYKVVYQAECEKFYGVPGKYFNATIDNRLMYLECVIILILIGVAPSIIKKYHESGVELRLREMGKKVGVEKVHPHKFRRTMATRAIEKGMPIEQV